jgi:hypothetical protein
VDCVRSRTFSGPYEGSSAAERQLQALLIATLLLAYTVLGAGPPENGAAAALSSLLFVFVKDAATAALPAGPKRYILVPLLDLANHSSRATSDLAYEYFQDEFSLILGGSYRTGEQVFVSYGNLDNEALLCLYGFVEEDNEHDVIAMGTQLALRAPAAAAALTADELATICVTRDGTLRPEQAAAKLYPALGGEAAAAAMIASVVQDAYPAAGAAAASAAAAAETAALARGRDRPGDVRSDEERQAAALAAQFHAAKHVTARAVLAALARTASDAVSRAA